MNPNNKLKWGIMADCCDDISVAETRNDFVEVSWTERKVALSGFDDYISKKYIPISAATTSMELPNSTIISQMNNNPIIH